MKKALTIGELLVTMAIIGVIATLVLPGFLKDYHNSLYTAHLKKVYEMLENAVNQACIDNNVSYFYQTPYVQTGKNSSTNKYYAQEFIDKYFKKALEQKTVPFSGAYGVIGYSTTRKFSTLSARHGWGKLVGGEAVSFWCAEAKSVSDTNNCIFRVDINSTDAPNVGGRDMFVININRNTNRLYDSYDAASCGGTNTSDSTKAHKEPSINFDGAGCLERIILDDWEMKY